MKKRWGILLAGWLALGVVAHAQQNFENVEIKAQPVRGNIYMLNGTGGNIGVSVGPDGVLIVDDKFAPLAEKIRAAVQGVGGGKLKFILNTHWHGDHTGANVVFGPEAPIIAHTNVRERMKSGMQIGTRNVPPAPKEALPVITFDQGLSVHFNGEEIRAIHFPKGHTDGDSIILFTGSNVAHLGDDYFSGRFPFVDIDSGGDVEGLTKIIAEVIQKLPADVKIIPGHGPISTLDDLKTYHQMLTETTELVRKKMKVGQALDEITKEGLPEKWASWNWNFVSADRWIETIHRSLSKKQ